MIALKDLQHHAVTLLQAFPYFAGVEIVEDLGKQEHDIEQALSTDGQVVIVPYLLDGDKPSKASEGTGVVVLLVGLLVIVMVNPKKATLNIYEMVTAAKDALLQYASPAGNPNDSYHVSTKAFIVDESDQGVVAYQCFFEKRCVF